MHPSDNIAPDIVTLPHGRAERFFGNDFRQNNMRFRVSEFEALRVKRRMVSGVSVQRPEL